MLETYGEYQEEYEQFVDELRFAGTFVFIPRHSGIDWRELKSVSHGRIVLYDSDSYPIFLNRWPG